MRLTEGLSSAEYAALSYQWGGPQELMLTKETASRLKTGVRLEDIPATFRDAIYVCEALGINCLWIDALCILQDGDTDQEIQDKDKELKLMTQIYSNAAVTVIASKAKNAYDGFLSERPATGSTDLDSTFLSSIRFYDTYTPILLVPARPTPNEPVDSRAWCLQERLMARRIIDIGSYQTRWECRESISDKSFQNYNNDTIDGWNSSCDGNTERSYELYGQLQRFFARKSHLTKEELWHKIVMTYCTRGLSEPEDKLPAIAGIAQVFAEYFKSEYICGLWSAHLSTSLLWECNYDRLQPPSPTYLAPSWSWASVDRPIHYHNYWTMADGGYYDRVNRSPVVHDYFQVCSTAVEYTVPDFAYGKVKRGAELRIKAASRAVLWAPEIEEIHFSKQLFTLVREEDEQKLAASFKVDCLDTEHERELKAGRFRVHMAVIGYEPNTWVSRINHDDGQIEEARAREPPWDNHDWKDWTLSPEEKRTVAKAWPTNEITGLVLQEISTHKYRRLGVFHFDVKLTEAWKDPSSDWDAKFTEYHKITKWIMDGEQKTFNIV
jgi:hypothetical protein